MIWLIDAVMRAIGNLSVGKKIKRQHDFSLKSYGESTHILPMSWEAELEEPDTLSFDNYSKRVCGAKGALLYSNCRI